MTDISDLETMLASESGLAVITTIRANGRPLTSVVNVGVMDHPIGGDRVVAFVARGDSARLGHLRRRPDINVLARRGWQWAAVDGEAELIGPDDPHPEVDRDGLRVMIREVFVAAGGTHDDFDEFDRVMVEDRRCVVLVAPERCYSNPS
jgi:PPOX class probable F420-dependent enzyme